MIIFSSKLYLLDGHNFEKLKVFEHNHRLSSVAFNNSDDKLMLGSDGYTSFLLNLKDLEVIAE